MEDYTLHEISIDYMTILDEFCFAFCVDQVTLSFEFFPCFSVRSFDFFCGVSGLGAFDVSDQGATF